MNFIVNYSCAKLYSVTLVEEFAGAKVARDNAILKKQQNINRYVHAYFSDNAEVMMELEGIDLMFSDQEVMPMSINDYREYMKERKDELTNQKGK